MKEKIRQYVTAYTKNQSIENPDQQYSVGNYLTLLGVLNFVAKAVRHMRPVVSRLMSAMDPKLRTSRFKHSEPLHKHLDAMNNVNRAH